MPASTINNTNKKNNEIDTHITLPTCTTNEQNISNENRNYTNYFHRTLHYFGLLSVSHLIPKDENINYYYHMLKGFSEMRACLNEDYNISENKIFKEIESFILPEKTKENTLSNCWYDFVDGQCSKNLYVLPVIFGWIEFILIIYINSIFILIIFNYTYELYYLKH